MSIIRRRRVAGRRRRPELVTNGKFNTSTAGWTPSGSGTPATAVVEDQTCKITTPGVTLAGIGQAISFVAGGRYRVSCRALSPSSNTAVNAAVLSVRTNGGIVGDGLSTQVSAEDVWQNLSFDFTATTQVSVHAFVLNRGVSWGAAGDIAYVDDISVIRIG